jgi:hypothetical protein
MVMRLPANSMSVKLVQLEKKGSKEWKGGISINGERLYVEIS